RPDVVWFGEGIPSRALRSAVAAAEVADVFLCVGTSAVVQPSASLPAMALRGGAYVAEVNIEETALSVLTHCSLRGKAGELLPALVQAVISHERRSGEAG
ncbi:MAG: NAD-dependent protein deacylase, partial [Chloroflexales bacterium]|nr:NAD-dependent protein deacylase [Chloroflexales bacterium]